MIDLYRVAQFLKNPRPPRAALSRATRYRPDAPDSRLPCKTEERYPPALALTLELAPHPTVVWLNPCVT